LNFKVNGPPFTDKTHRERFPRPFEVIHICPSRTVQAQFDFQTTGDLTYLTLHKLTRILTCRWEGRAEKVIEMKQDNRETKSFIEKVSSSISGGLEDLFYQ